MSDDDWIAQLQQVYEADKAQQQAKEQIQAAQEKKNLADAFMQQSRAHELMRQAQRVLLKGEGILRFYENVGEYNRAIALMWKGPISAASKPANLKDVDVSIIIGANDQGIFVNDQKLAEPTPEALKKMLLTLVQDLTRK